MKRFSLMVGVVGLFLVAAMLASPAQAVSKKYISIDSIAASRAPGVIDTSSTISTGAYDTMDLFVAYEGDSSLVTVQGSIDGSAWYTLSSFTLNGVDGTRAIQFYGPIVTKGGAAAAIGTLSEFPLAPLNYTRLILNNNDAAGADTLGNVEIKLIMGR